MAPPAGLELGEFERIRARINFAKQTNHDPETKKPHPKMRLFKYGSACWARTSDPMINN